MGEDFLFILKAIIISIVEGITEFIPVSSTGHIILVSSIIGFSKSFVDIFEVVIQLGAALAVVVLYWKKIKDSIIEFFTYIFTKGKKGKLGFYFLINMIIGCIPIGVVDILFYKHKYIKMFFYPKMISTGLIVGGILLILIENKFRKNKKHSIKNIDSITVIQALKIGVFQLLALWPGMSRSASTIMGGWVAGLSTSTAAEFSFFLAVPAIIGSSINNLFEFDFSIMNITLWIIFIIGFIIAFIVAFIVMDKFISYLKKRPMRVFAVYRVAIGVVFAVLIILGMNFNI